MDKAMDRKGDFLFYNSEDGKIKIQVIVEDETVWMSQKGMQRLFGASKSNVSEHLKNIFATNELDKSSTVRNIRTVQMEGERKVKRNVIFHNLDCIIALGYRVNSLQATQFRRWATGILKEYLLKGFVLNDERLKQGSQMFGKDYFDELIERIREIRASERRFYQKITDLYAQCSIDYEANSKITQDFYATVQNKLHWAIHNNTAAELISKRADSTKPKMGLSSYKNSKKDGKILKGDVVIAKNYLREDEIRELNRVVTMYLDFAENMASRHRQMRMVDWIERLDSFLEFNEYSVLKNQGRISAKRAKKIAENEYSKYRVIQDREFESDFDKVVKEIKETNKLPSEKKIIKKEPTDFDKKIDQALNWNPKEN